MVSSELKHLVNGQLGYSRERAPEPLLLPRIATRISPDGLIFTASVANTLSNSNSVPLAWPSVAEATATAIAERHAELADALVRELCLTLPQLPAALIRFDPETVQRVANIVGIDTANRIQAGLNDPDFLFKEAMAQVFSEAAPPGSVEELNAYLRKQIEWSSPDVQGNILAYFLPLVGAEQKPWMTALLISVLDRQPAWVPAAAASRLAGLLDHDATDQIDAILSTVDYPWSTRARELLIGDPAGSVFEEVTRVLPYDSRFEQLLASEMDKDLLPGFVEEIINTWGGAPAQAAAADEPVFLGMEDEDETGLEDDPFSSYWDEDEAAEEAEIDLDTPMGIPPRPVTAPASEPVPEPIPHRKLQTQVQADVDGMLITVCEGFRKNTLHDVRMWIGPESHRAIVADAALEEPTPDVQEQQRGSMDISITLVHASKHQSQTIKLPVDQKQKSKPAKFTLDVGNDAQFISADVWLQHKGRVIQYLKLNGLVMDEPGETQKGIALKAETLIRGIPDDPAGSDFGMAMVKKDDNYIVFGPRGVEKTEASLQGASDMVGNINNALFKATKVLVRASPGSRGTSWVDDQNKQAMNLLCLMARQGNLLYKELRKEGVLDRIAETIQFVNLDETDIVPIEYIYDKGYPAEDCGLCEGFKDTEDWHAIFKSGKCSCSNHPDERSGTLCPMGFWSLSKIIERQPRRRPGKNEVPQADFESPTANGPELSVRRRAVFGAAPNVQSLDVDLVTSLLEETYKDRHSVVLNWTSWEAEIDKESPKLMILMPHHGEAAGGHTDFLEIGRPGDEHGAKLYAGTLKKALVSNKPNEPGPIVLLLGCETAQPDLAPFHTFARDFLANRASVVVATQASVLGQHAAPVANEFIRQLLASTDSNESFGKIMRDVRRKMFTSGYLMSLALVSFGDTDWTLEAGQTGDNDVPH